MSAAIAELRIAAGEAGYQIIELLRDFPDDEHAARLLQSIDSGGETRASTDPYACET